MYHYLDNFSLNIMSTGLDSEYVTLHLDDILTELLAELVQIKPTDPIEWLANALRQHARKVKAQKVCGPFVTAKFFSVDF